MDQLNYFFKTQNGFHRIRIGKKRKLYPENGNRIFRIVLLKDSLYFCMLKNFSSYFFNVQVFRGKQIKINLLTMSEMERDCRSAHEKKILIEFLNDGKRTNLFFGEYFSMNENIF